MSAEQVQRFPEVSSSRMVGTLGAVAMLSGFLVVLAFQLTLPHIEENRRQAIERAVFEVIPGAVSRRDFVLSGEALAPAGEKTAGTRIYAGYDAEGQLKGIATEAAAPGYADLIRILYGYSPACQCITGISVLQTKETPGLGDKIITDPTFRANFEALDARLDSAGMGLANAIVTVKHGTKSEPWQIDAISGATVSSNAIGKMLNDSAQALLPQVMKQLNTLQVDP